MIRNCVAAVALFCLGLLLAGCGGDAEGGTHPEGSAASPCAESCSHDPAPQPADTSHESHGDECNHEPAPQSVQPSHDEHGDGCSHEPASKPVETSHDEHGDACSSHTEKDGVPYCGEHDLYEAECGICRPGLACELEPGEGLKIRLPSQESEAKASIAAEYPRRGPSSTNVVAVGQLELDGNRLAHVTPLADGVVQRVFAELGQKVSRGDVLAEINSSVIAEAKAALLTALADETVASEALARERELFEKDMSSERALRDVEALHTAAMASHRAAERTLLDLGLSRQALERTVSEREVSSVLPLIAPFDGTVIERDAVVGDLVEVGDRMFTVTDLSTLWVTLAVSERDVARLSVGQPVTIRSSTLGRVIEGEISWVSSVLNETTRMAEVRAEIPNRNESLRAGMFVDASIVIDESHESLLVPRDTVYSFDGDPFVFVRLESDLYELRRVQTGSVSGEDTVVVAGLSEDDLVAVEQSYLLKSEFQKSRFGVGCAH